MPENCFCLPVGNECDGCDGKKKDCAIKIIVAKHESMAVKKELPCPNCPIRLVRAMIL
ncbi:MAG: hypothetical protein PHE24_02040 [Patescibacteria group bacterium]|nr:hypothetical protein [Patescibacteria group bacterium]